MRLVASRLVFAVSLTALWEAAVRLSDVRPFIFPAPSRVLSAFFDQPGYFAYHAGITASEIVLGLAVGTALGMTVAIILAIHPALQRGFGPILASSQALPVYAIAPLLVIWLGFGMASKIAMACLIIFFPIATAFYDGLRRTDPHLLDLATINGANAWQRIRLIRIPWALPQLGSGIRIAATIAPIGAVVGEWVGAAGGLGFVMLQANARTQTDIVFVAVIILALMVLLLTAAVNRAIRYALPWVPGESLESK